MKKIGVLALQGAFREHISIIGKLGHQAVEVRKSCHFKDLDGLILPGGESTAIWKLILDFNLADEIREHIKKGLPVWGTCAGMILLASELDSNEQAHLKLMDIRVKRNAYGRQLDSFVSKEAVKEVSDEPIPLVFIRAPYIVKTWNDVKVVHRTKGNITAAQQKNMLVTAFHPELTDDTAFHEYFIKMCGEPC